MKGESQMLLDKGGLEKGDKGKLDTFMVVTQEEVDGFGKMGDLG